MTSGTRAWMLAAPLVLVAGLARAESWLDTEATVRALAEAEEFRAAIALGDDLLAEVGAQFGESSSELAGAELLLAEVHRKAGEPAEAAQRIRAAIDILKAGDAPDTRQLIDASVALGKAYVAADAPALAVVAFEAAKDLSRRSFGLLNQEQIGILYLMSAAALADGDYEGAVKFRSEAIEVGQRSRLEALRVTELTFGRGSPEFVEEQLRYASWLDSLGRAYDARLAYADTLKLVRHDLGNPPELTVRVLQEMTASVGVPGITLGLGFAVETPPRELVRARRVANRMIEPDPVLRAALLRDLGDWHLLLGRPERTERNYRLASDLLAQVPGGAALEHQWFVETQALRPPGNQLIRSGVLTLAREAPRGHVDVSLVVDARGRANDIRVTSAEPAWMTAVAVRQVANARFRPRLQDGVLVAAPGQYKWEFHYDAAVAEGLGLTG